MELSEIKLAVIGLGYVGLPLAVAFGKNRSVVGYNIINVDRVNQLKEGLNEGRTQIELTLR
jgi:UDP-N-acetyl-D-galactosamine dehydrogenase